MKFKGSVIKEQGVTFAIIIVKPHVLNNSQNIQNAQEFGRRAFGMIPIILMAQNSKGVPTYYGRKDIAQFLSRIPMSRIPWKEYSID